MEKTKHLFPALLLVIYLVEMLVLAINPYNRGLWWAENIPVMIPVALLVLTYRSYRFSNRSYFLMAFFLMFHTIGGHFSFSRVPFDIFNDLLAKLNLDFLFPNGRNNFDRVGHYLVGVFAYPVAELALAKRWVVNRWVAVVLGIFAVGFWAAFYEIVEMVFAVNAGSANGTDFLGSQGDIWDAQKDMALDILGAFTVSVLFLLRSPVRDR